MTNTEEIPLFFPECRIWNIQYCFKNFLTPVTYVLTLTSSVVFGSMMTFSLIMKGTTLSGSHGSLVMLTLTTLMVTWIQTGDGLRKVSGVCVERPTQHTSGTRKSIGASTVTPGDSTGWGMTNIETGTHINYNQLVHRPVSRQPEAGLQKEACNLYIAEGSPHFLTHNCYQDTSPIFR